MLGLGFIGAGFRGLGLRFTVNSFKGPKEVIGRTIGLLKGDTRSLDSKLSLDRSSCDPKPQTLHPNQ